MTTQTAPTKRQSRLLRMLDDERRTILNGPLLNLGPLVARREEALAELIDAEKDLPESFLKAMRGKAERNGALLKASLDGVKSARDRLGEIQKAQRELNTYDASGARVSVKSQSVTRDKRA